ncbi:MAG: hypothetical protein QXP36_02415 [Conexivisphaerales archaeon]
MEVHLTNYEKKIIKKALSGKALEKEEVARLLKISIVSNDGSVIPLVKSVSKAKSSLKVVLNEVAKSLPLETKEPISSILTKFVSIPVSEQELAKECDSSLDAVREELKRFKYAKFTAKGMPSFVYIYGLDSKEPDVYYDPILQKLVLSDEYRNSILQKHPNLKIDEVLEKVEDALKKEKEPIKDYKKFFEYFVRNEVNPPEEVEFLKKYAEFYRRYKNVSVEFSYNKSNRELAKKLINLIKSNGETVDSFLEKLFSSSSWFSNRVGSLYFVYNRYGDIVDTMRRMGSRANVAVIAQANGYDKRSTFFKGKDKISVCYKGGIPVKVEVNGIEIDRDKWGDYVGEL